MKSNELRVQLRLTARRARRRRGPAIPVMVALASCIAFASCASVQWTDAMGAPRSFGFARIETSVTDPRISRVRAPGLSLRLIPGLEGVGIGWRETVLFLSEESGPDRKIVAFADSIYGIAVDNGQLVLGLGRSFAVIQPDPEDSILQYIEFHADDFHETSMRRQRVR